MGILGQLPIEIYIILMSATPIVELRGAIPLAWQMGLQPGPAFFLAVLGNLLPVIPLLLALSLVRDFTEKRIPSIKSFFAWLDQRTHRRSDRVEKYGVLGLILLTAIPLPTTGAWTASLAAVLFKLPFWSSFFAITGGVILAGLLVMFFTFGFVPVILGLG